jgi:RimJ/RimL family protein N-acetyltransferase
MMKSVVRIRRLPTTRWREYRALRLGALRGDPQAFGSSYEREMRLQPKEWKVRMKNALFAMSDDEPVGMVVCFFNESQKIRHIANIFGFFVKREFRGLGIGGLLIEAAIRAIRRNKRVMKIDLTVNTRQKAAVALYERYGFKPIGVLKKDLYVGGKYYDGLIMEKFV